MLNTDTEPLWLDVKRDDSQTRQEEGLQVGGSLLWKHFLFLFFMFHKTLSPVMHPSGGNDAASFWLAPVVRAVFQIASPPLSSLSPVNREQYRQFRVTVAVAVCGSGGAEAFKAEREGYRSWAKTSRLQMVKDCCATSETWERVSERFPLPDGAAATAAWMDAWVGWMLTCSCFGWSVRLEFGAGQSIYLPSGLETLYEKIKTQLLL